MTLEHPHVRLRGVVVGVYRYACASRVLSLVPPGWPCAFWALDEVAPVAAEMTLGSGPGTKFELCNRLIASLRLANEDWIVVVDDDVLVPRGLQDLVRLSHEAGLGLTQPAHARTSHASHQITRRRLLHRARWQTYVEIGPVFAIAPDWRAQLVPFPEHIGMGWGLELQWMDLEQHGMRLGIIDGVAMEHLVPPGRTYDLGPEGDRLRAMLAQRGARQLADVMRVHGRWWSWQRRAPWIR